MPSASKGPAIRIRGAGQNNLKHLDLDIPLNRMTVITGVSGSGKSSLALDTLYAEGQRRYVETFSPYARQFMERMDRPRAELIEGIPPAIAIDRKDPVRTSRSTVGTMTEITDHVKLLYGRLGQLHCRSCGRPVKPETVQDAWRHISTLPAGSELVITFPFPAEDGEGGAPAALGRMGFTRFLDGDRVRSLETWSGRKRPVLQVVADRLRFDPRQKSRVVDSLEQAFEFGQGRAGIWSAGRFRLFSSVLECPGCALSYRAPMPNLFSFNSPVGACGTCRGFGRVIDIDPDLIIPDPELSLVQGAVKPWGDAAGDRTEYRDLLAFCRRSGIPARLPFRKLSADQKRAIFEGSQDYYGVRGFFEWLERKTYKMHVRVFLSRFRSYRVCGTCRGTRFKEEALLYRLGGLNIGELYALRIEEAKGFFGRLQIAEGDEAGRTVLQQVQGRLRIPERCGPGVSDPRSPVAHALRGGSAAGGPGLGPGLLPGQYPVCAGRAQHRASPARQPAVDQDPEESEGPPEYGGGRGARPGDHPGERLPAGSGTRGRGARRKGHALRAGGGDRRLPHRTIPARGEADSHAGAPQETPARALAPDRRGFGAQPQRHPRANPVGPAGMHHRRLGIGQIHPGRRGAVPRREAGPEGPAGPARTVQSPEGRGRAGGRRAGGPETHRPDPPLKPSQLRQGAGPGAAPAGSDAGSRQRRGFQATHFSFNTEPGRCATCSGEGFEKVEMQFLSDVFVTCPDCEGRRFTREVLEVRYRERNIHEILNLTVQEALAFFADRREIADRLGPLEAVGLGYMRLGQPINTLSGGEAQRLKLSRFLGPRDGGRLLFILDEPTTGLHFDDIRNLLAALQRLVEQGHSVVVIEHNLDLVKAADWIIDLGPEGGEGGGEVVVAGPPEAVAAHPGSHTGRFLKHSLGGGNRLNGRRPDSPAEEPPARAEGFISVLGAREHNLRDLDLSIPRGQLVVLTGLSGSGKSTLAFDILFAEGQRRYLESLAPYVRQYVKILERPEVDAITGLPPTVAIEQRVSHASRRSTVATLTEIYHFLRLLFSKIGVPHCPKCQRRLSTQSAGAIVAAVRQRYRRRAALILAPKVTGRKGFHKQVLARALRQGFGEARIDGTITVLEPGMALSRYHEHSIELVAGRLPARDWEGVLSRALREGGGSIILQSAEGGEEIFSVSGRCPTCGVGAPSLDPRLFSFNSRHGACPGCEGLGVPGGEQGTGRRLCRRCGGSRLKPEALAVKVGGRSIWDLAQLPAESLKAFFADLVLDERETAIARPVKAEILSRLRLLSRLGLSYLALSRSGDTLSGGEAQRVRLAAQLGSNLTGVCYILDEPTIGLHARDNRRLLEALEELKERGNSIIVVEHDEETIRHADTIVDLGPGGGQHGGQVVAMGRLADLQKIPASITGACFNGHSHRLTSRLRDCEQGASLRVRGATRNNLRDIDVRFPLGTLICVTGVSGSGKSSLLRETLYAGLLARLNGRSAAETGARAIEGWKEVARVREVDHSPIGRTPRSVPASYVGFLNRIRALFALTPLARARGYRPGRFSFNVAGGRCESCKGHGSLKVVMSFLPDVYVHCEACDGRRFTPETLAVTYRGKNMAQVLDMTFEEAREFFAAVPAIRQAADLVTEVGLGYLRLGQSSPTLSGGEAQRIKLAEELSRRSNGHGFYVLDEPTTGLHLADVQRLVQVLQALVEQGNTVAVIEHNLEIVKEADYIIDLGPEGGEQGGRVVAAGSPADLIARPNGSHTARFLKRYLDGAQEELH